MLAHYTSVDKLTVNEAYGFSLVLLLSRFAVPLFVFISGVVLFYNSRDKKFKTVSFLRNRLLKIFLPYVLWSMIFYFAYKGSPFNLLQDTKTITEKILNGSAMYHLWYMAMIFQFYLIYPFIRKTIIKMFDRKDSVGILSLITIFLLYYLVLNISYKYVPLYVRKHGGNTLINYILRYRDRNILLWFFYFIFGAYAGIKLDNFKKHVINKFSYVLILFTGLSIYLFYLSIKSVHFINGGYIANHNLTSPIMPIMAVYCTLAILLLYRIAIYLSNLDVVYKLLKIVSKYSLGGYFIHTLMVHYIGDIVPIVFPSMNVEISFILAYSMSATAAVLSTFYICKVPILNILAKGFSKAKSPLKNGLVTVDNYNSLSKRA